MAVAVTNIGTASSTSGATGTLGSVTTPAGANIVVLVADSSSSATPGTLSDGTNTYTAIATVNLGSSGTTSGLLVAFLCPNAAALSGATLTYTKAVSGSHSAISAFYVTGTVPIADTSVLATAHAASGTTITATSGTPSRAGDLFIGALAYASSGIFNQDTTNASWATPPNAIASATTISVAGGTVVNAGKGTLTYAPTISIGANWAEIIFAIKVGAVDSVSDSSTTSEANSGPAQFSGVRADTSTTSDSLSTKAAFAASISEVQASSEIRTANGTFLTSLLDSMIGEDEFDGVLSPFWNPQQGASSPWSPVATGSDPWSSV